MNPTSFDEKDLHTHLAAYNMAFADLGLRFRWDVATLASLAGLESEAAAIAAYIEAHHPHLLTAYSAECLSRAILEKKRALRPEPLLAPAIGTIETNRPSLLQERARETHGSTDFGLPMLAGA
jgi:hypothetical protein